MTNSLDLASFNEKFQGLLHAENEYYQKLDHFYRFFFQNMEFSNIKKVRDVAETSSVASLHRFEIGGKDDAESSPDPRDPQQSSLPVGATRHRQSRVVYPAASALRQHDFSLRVLCRRD